jgi:hypothetical protein
MFFPNFWQRAKTGDVATWGWSDVSEDDALRKARERQARVLALLRSGEGTLARYGYPDRPMREEVLREFRLPGGSVVATISRNSVGCQVLNTDGLLFVDVDTTDTSSGVGLPRSSAWPKATRSADQARGGCHHAGEGVGRLKSRLAMAALPNQGRRSPDGLRIDPSPPPIRWCSEYSTASTPIHSTGSYARTNAATARGSPPSRGGAERTKRRIAGRGGISRPSRSSGRGTRITTATSWFATCKFLGKIGSAGIASEFREIVQFHDDETGAYKDCPLA